MALMIEQDFTGRYPHCTRINVTWGEMDALGHINNIIYFRYMESARIDYFVALGIDPPTIDSTFGPILAHIECQFMAAVMYPDEVLVSSRIHSFGRTSMKIEHVIFSCSQGKVVARGDSVIVMIDYTNMRKKEIPESMKKRIVSFQE